MPEDLRDHLARDAAVEQFHGASAAPAVGAEPSDVGAHSGEGVRRQGEKGVAFHADPKVRLGVQAVVLPLPIDGQAMDRHADLVQWGRQGPDVGWPGRELARAAADLPWRQRRPKAGSQLGEDRRVQRVEPRKAEPDAFEEREGSRAGVRRVGEYRRLSRQVCVRLRPEDRQVDEVGEDDGIADLSLHEIVEAEGGPAEHGGASHGLLAGPLPDRQGSGRAARSQAARPPAPSAGEGGECGNRRQLVAEDRAGPPACAAEGATQASAYVDHQGVPCGGGYAS